MCIIKCSIIKIFVDLRVYVRLYFTNKKYFDFHINLSNKAMELNYLLSRFKWNRIRANGGECAM